MNPRIIKEVRLLFWPWCLVILAALMPVVSDVLRHFHELSSLIWGFGSFGGISFLAAFSLGGEFQHRTLSLLLGQPVDRAKIWAEKQMVLVLAVILVVALSALTCPEPSVIDVEVLLLFGTWLLATLCSATVWTLVSRTTIGGLVIGQAMQFILGAVLVNLGLRIFGPDVGPQTYDPKHSEKMLHVAEAMGVMIGLVYSGFMLWLGRRMLMRFQATGGPASGDLLMTGPRMMPASLADVLRCRATSPTLNLVRKELRLLRPLWLIMLLFLACWTCVIVTFPLLPEGAEWQELRAFLPVLVLVFYMPLALMLAGCLSLGEERSSGTHAWHLTLPVPASRQWLVKLVMALGAGAFSGLIIPCLAVSAGQWLLGPSFVPVFNWDPSWADLSNALIPIALTVFASFPAFWCASAANGSVRAALWVLPVMGALCFAGALGGWCAEKSSGAVGEIVTAIISKYQINPYRLPTPYAGPLAPVLFVMPTVLVAIVQSRRLFRTQRKDGIWSVVPSLVPLVGTTFVCCWLIWTMAFTFNRQHWSYLVYETQQAIEQISLTSTALDPAHPLQVTADDLAAASPISEGTRQWLRGASITMTQISDRPGRYRATIRFPDGSDYPLASYRPRKKLIPAG